MGLYQHDRRWWSAVIALLLLLCPAFACSLAAHGSPKSTSPELGLLKTVRAVQSLSSAEAARGYPVHLTATVAFYEPFIGTDIATLFVHDATGGIFLLTPARQALPLHEGTVIDVRGVSDAGAFAPVVANVEMHVVGQARMPSTAPLVDLNQLMTGSFDSQWVQLEGIVHAVRPQGRDMIMKIATDNGPIMATVIQEPEADYGRLIGARIRAFAVVGSRFNKRRQLAGVHLFISTLRDVKVLKYGPRNPFELPKRSIKGWSEFEIGQQRIDRVHLRGAVTLQRPGQLLCVEDATGGLCVDTLDTTAMPIGSAVDVVGFRAFEDGSPRLIDAVYRSVSSVTEPTPVTPVKAKEVLQGRHPDDLVELEGEIAGWNADPREASALIASDGFVFSALLPTGLAVSDLPRWQKGSRVRVRGICASIASRQLADEEQGIENYEGFRLLLRSPDDLTVVRRPSWWTPLHAVLTLSIVLATTLGALAWALMLHRRVRLQTGMLQESERRYRHLAYHDSLTGLPNRTLLQLRLSAAIEQATITKRCLALLMLDLDGFKQVNDRLGHNAGDIALRTVAGRLGQIVREPDTVARIGGDEFVVLLLGSRTTGDACACADEILQSLAMPLEIGAESASLSCSIGVSVFDARVDDQKSLLKKADTAMYGAKAGGRNQFRVSPEDRSRDIVGLSREVEGVPHAEFMTRALG